MNLTRRRSRTSGGSIKRNYYSRKLHVGSGTLENSVIANNTENSKTPNNRNANKFRISNVLRKYIRENEPEKHKAFLQKNKEIYHKFKEENPEKYRKLLDKRKEYRIRNRKTINNRQNKSRIRNRETINNTLTKKRRSNSTPDFDEYVKNPHNDLPFITVDDIVHNRTHPSTPDFDEYVKNPHNDLPFITVDDIISASLKK